MSGFMGVPGGLAGAALGARAGTVAADEIARERGYQTEATAALVTQLFGTLSGMVGSFFAAESDRNQLKSQALDLEHAQSMAGINARLAAADANAILEAGRDEVAMSTLEHGQAKESERARQGASGFVGGQGSGAEVLASIEVAKRIDAATINKNTVRAASQRRLQATDWRNRGAAAGASAANLRGARGAIQPGLSAVASGLNSGASLISRYADYRSGRFM